MEIKAICTLTKRDLTVVSFVAVDANCDSNTPKGYAVCIQNSDNSFRLEPLSNLRYVADND